MPDRRETCQPVSYFPKIVRFARLDLLKAEDVLEALKDSGAS